MRYFVCCRYFCLREKSGTLLTGSRTEFFGYKFTDVSGNWERVCILELLWMVLILMIRYWKWNFE